MSLLRFRSRLAAGSALAAMALNAFWPLLANASPRIPAIPLEICSATGQKHAGGGASGEAPGKGVQPSHCTLCPFNAERGAVTLTSTASLPDAIPAARPLPEFLRTPRAESALDPSAPPRAPPLLS